ncbi:carbohydrate ABC transporter permease [Clostridium lacusfryxellense]|uniref:carbohydrate ABC transporter permease n=1 Tax=Clostridium lacusfryxellense TaxID=205328 RepID=UPI001C0D94BB|nr:sugar ABC transporter permease [Clostridium lacusfryxellense]MBU3113019.1 sugar ABC transporter permease [Clostridium lacusfryxellense]
MNGTARKIKKKRHNASFGIGQGKFTPFFFLAPAIIVLTMVVAYPLIYEIIISFKNVTLLNLKSQNYPWIGIENYKNILADSLFYSTLIRTIIWTAINIFFHVSIGLFLAIILNRKLPGKALIRVLLILPWAVPQYIAAMTWKGMYNVEYGSINIILTKIFGNVAAIPWLSVPSWTFVACIITNIWLGIPFMMMISLGGLSSVPEELYEAADLDGATNFQKFKSITLPLLKPILTPAIILGTVWTFNMVNVVYIITSGSASDESQILITMVFKRAFQYFRYGQSAALSVIIFLILLAFSTIFIRAQKSED